MELVPEDELESSMQSRSISSADQRAKKVGIFLRTCFVDFIVPFLE